ncbi:MAG TPA: 1,4-dihydroxy-2-naphthoate polyprenyltransferase [Thermomicrobiaceae bacterium]|nr:1,4-dihydroxy-2-naphthoate polyprenyltransferase [Thermomicrobiaceae bacterium]
MEQGVTVPRPSAWRAWVHAARPPTLPAAVVPVLVGTAAGVRDASFHLLPFLGAFIAALLIQIGTNFANDLSDFHKGADTESRVGPARITASGIATPSQVRKATIVTFGLALLIGLYLVAVGGWPILVIGLASILAGLAYTGGPWPLGYHGLGDIFVFVFFGVIAVAGSAYLQTGDLSTLALAASIPVGLLVTNILVINNLRDLATDRAAGKNTLAVRLGPNPTRVQYALFSVVAYVVPALLIVAHLAPLWALLPWLTLPLAARLTSTVLGGMTGRSLNRVLQLTGQLHLLFGILFALGLLL